MSYSFEYIDIILLAMIAGFIFLRLRGILGKKTGFEEDLNPSFSRKNPEVKPTVKLNPETFDENAKKEFLKGARIAYESIITSFSRGKIKDIKSLLDINVYEQFNIAIDERKSNNYLSETTFIGINSVDIKNHQQNKNMLEVTVEFVSEIISVKKDKNDNVIEGDSNKIKTVIDRWKFTRKISSSNPNWYLAEIKTN